MLKFKRKTAIHIQLPESFLGIQKVLGIPPVGFPKGFSLRRRKGFTEVWVHFENGLRLNLTTPGETWPKNFREARLWAQRFADAHGMAFHEVPR